MQDYMKKSVQNTILNNCSKLDLFNDLYSLKAVSTENAVSGK